MLQVLLLLLLFNIYRILEIDIPLKYNTIHYIHILYYTANSNKTLLINRLNNQWIQTLCRCQPIYTSTTTQQRLPSNGYPATTTTTATTLRITTLRITTLLVSSSSKIQLHGHIHCRTQHKHCAIHQSIPIYQ